MTPKLFRKKYNLQSCDTDTVPLFMRINRAIEKMGSAIYEGNTSFFESGDFEEYKKTLSFIKDILSLKKTHPEFVNLERHGNNLRVSEIQIKMGYQCIQSLELITPGFVLTFSRLINHGKIRAEKNKT